MKKELSSDHEVLHPYEGVESSHAILDILPLGVQDHGWLSAAPGHEVVLCTVIYWEYELIVSRAGSVRLSDDGI